MITPKTLKLAINQLVKNSFPGISVIAQDVEKGFAQPSFTIRFEEYKPEQIQESIEQSLTVRIFYFPDFNDEDMSIDVLEKMFEVPRIFGNKLFVEDRALNIIDPEVIEVDGVLEFSFNLLFEQYDITNDPELNSNAELMQGLQIDIKKEGN